MAAEIEEKRLARAAEAPYCPFTATVTSVVIAAPADVTLPEGGQIPWEVVHEDSTLVPAENGGRRTVGEVAFMAMHQLRMKLNVRNGLSGNPAAMVESATHLCGLRIREKLQLLAIDAMRYAKNAGLSFSIPAGLWWHPNFSSPIWCDPYDVVVPSDQRHWVKYEQLADYLRIPFPCDGVENDALAQVHFAGEIARAANL